MNKPLIFLLALMVGSGCLAADQAADFYLSPVGSDEWSGTLAEANEEKTDGPFATLERARNAVQVLKDTKQGDIDVLIRGGNYQLDETVVFRLNDSGKGKSIITYAAYSGETPVFSSGEGITGWKKVSDTLTGLPEVAKAHVRAADVSGRFHTLYDEKGMLPRARTAGFKPTADGNQYTLNFPEGRVKDWPNVKDVEIVIRPLHHWIVNVLPLKRVNEEKQFASTSIRATYAMKPVHYLNEDLPESCWVENVLEGLDEPGEWALNTKTEKLYLWPRNESPVLAPRLIEYIRVEGKIDEDGPTDIPVRNLCFRGLTFMHGDRYTINEDDKGLQHDWDFLDKANALVRLRGTENCTIDQCHFAHSGSDAIRVDLHGQKNTISNNHIEHIGATGILLCGYGPGTKDVNKNNLVLNNHVHDTGRIYSHAPGIFLWQSGDNRVANNLVHDTPYCGMIFSGCILHFFEKPGRELYSTIRQHEIGTLPKGPTIDDVRPFLHTRNNLIEYNEVHHAMESLGDGNGIYVRGAGPGNIIRRNYVHHLLSPMLMQAAIRTDGGQTDTLVAENLIYKCTAQGIILKLNNRCENNFIVDILGKDDANYLFVREAPMTGATIQKNILYSTDKESHFFDEPEAKGKTKTEDRKGRDLARIKDADTDFNIYFCQADPAKGDALIEKNRGDGIDANSEAVDPMFVDPENGDFRFQPDSPALKMGIVPIDVSKIGLQNISSK